MSCTVAKTLGLLLMACIVVMGDEAENSRHFVVPAVHGGAFRCPASEGLFPIQGDCVRYVACGRGYPHVESCPDRLVFNPRTRRCDRSGNVPECAGRGHPSNGLCARNPGIPGQAWLVAHPTFCNAFFTCEEGYVHRRCSFCAEGTYFLHPTGTCVAVDDHLVAAACGNRQVVAHRDKVLQSLTNACNLFASNPYQAILDKILSGATDHHIVWSRSANGTATAE